MKIIELVLLYRTLTWLLTYLYLFYLLPIYPFLLFSVLSPSFFSTSDHFYSLPLLLTPFLFLCPPHDFHKFLARRRCGKDELIKRGSLYGYQKLQKESREYHFKMNKMKMYRPTRLTNETDYQYRKYLSWSIWPARICWLLLSSFSPR